MRKSLHIDPSHHLEQIRSLSDSLIMPVDGRPSIVPPTAAFQDISAPYSAVSTDHPNLHTHSERELLMSAT